MTQESDSFDPKERLRRLLREVEEARAPGVAALTEVLRPFEEIETLAAGLRFDLPEVLRETLDEISSSPALESVRQIFESFRPKLDHVQAIAERFSGVQVPELNIPTVPTQSERWAPRCACRCPFANANLKGERE